MCCARAQVMVKIHEVVCSTGTTDVDWIVDMLSLPWSSAPVGCALPWSLLIHHCRGCNISLFSVCCNSPGAERLVCGKILKSCTGLLHIQSIRIIILGFFLNPVF